MYFEYNSGKAPVLLPASKERNELIPSQKQLSISPTSCLRRVRPANFQRSSVLKKPMPGPETLLYKRPRTVL